MKNDDKTKKTKKTGETKDCKKDGSPNTSTSEAVPPSEVVLNHPVMTKKSSKKVDENGLDDGMYWLYWLYLIVDC